MFEAMDRNQTVRHWYSFFFYTCLIWHRVFLFLNSVVFLFFREIMHHQHPTWCDISNSKEQVTFNGSFCLYLTVCMCVDSLRKEKRTNKKNRLSGRKKYRGVNTLNFVYFFLSDLTCLFYHLFRFHLWVSIKLTKDSSSSSWYINFATIGAQYMRLSLRNDNTSFINNKFLSSNWRYYSWATKYSKNDTCRW